jgi:hypothetical protein
MLCRSSFHGSSRPAARDFPLALDLQYKVLGDKDEGATGTGRTLWMSSREIMFETDRALATGTDLEITIAWPARIEDRVLLQLCIRAAVLHTLSLGVTAEIRKYEFRTASCLSRRAGAVDDAPALVQTY